VAPEEPVSVRATLLLLAIALGLGAYAYFVERPAQEQKAAKKTLLDIDRDTVAGLTLAYGDREIVLRKGSDGTWRVVAPIDAPADRHVVDNLISAIADAEVSRTIDDPGEDLSPYGLDKPEVTVRLELTGGAAAPPALLVGKQTPIGFKAYARKEGDKALYLTTGAFHSGVKKEVKDVRDKTIVEFEDKDVRSLTLARRDGPRIVIRQTDGAWSVAEPAQYAADAAEVRSLLSSLRGLRAQDFIDGATEEDLVTYGLATPALEVTLSLGEDDTRKSVRLGSEAPGTPKRIYARRGEQETVFLVGDWNLANLDKGVGKLRDKTMLSFETGDVTGVTIRRRGEPPFTLARGEDGAWTLPGQSDPVKSEEIDRFLDDVRQTKPREIVSDDPADFARYGLGDPDLQVSVMGKDGTTMGTLVAVKAAPPEGENEPDATGGDKYYFAREGLPTVYEGQAYQLTRLSKTASDFLEKKPEAEGEKPGAEDGQAGADDGEADGP
jgi:hypothetical protein